MAALALALTVLLGACSTDGTGSADTPVQVDPTPQTVQETLPAADDGQLWLPYQFGSLALVDPGWESATVQQLHGLFATMRPDGEALRFAVTDSEGTTLWQAQRAGADTDFALTTTEDGQDVAVLTDSTDSSGTTNSTGATDSSDATTSADTPSTPTASAYDLGTGELLWGPVEVPGPLQGPGLVFGPAGPSGQSGQNAVALSAATGDEITAQDLGVARILGEYDGVVLSLDSEAVRATRVGADGPGEELWTLLLSENGWDEANLAAPARIHPGEGLALLNTAPSSAASSGATPIEGALLDLTDGEILAEGVSDVLTDAATGSVVYLKQGSLHGRNPRTGSQWQAEVGESARLSAAGGAIVYVRDDDTIRAYNVLTGDVAEAYDPDGSGTLTFPEMIAPSGAALLRAGEQRYLATTLPGEDVDVTGQG